MIRRRLAEAVTTDTAKADGGDNEHIRSLESRIKGMELSLKALVSGMRAEGVRRKEFNDKVETMAQDSPVETYVYANRTKKWHISLTP